MSITKHTDIDKIEIVGEYKHVQVRTATIILEDEKEISRTFHRHVIAPKDDYSNEPEQVQAICRVVFTDNVVNSYNEYITQLTSQQENEHNNQS